MDAAFWSELLQKVLIVAVPTLSAALVALAVAWINKVTKNLSADQMAAIKTAVDMAVNFAEQTGLDKTGEARKAEAIAAAQGYLAKQHITVDLTLLDNMIEAAVATELNWSKIHVVADVPPEPVINPSAPTA